MHDYKIDPNRNRGCHLQIGVCNVCNKFAIITKHGYCTSCKATKRYKKSLK